MTAKNEDQTRDVSRQHHDRRLAPSRWERQLRWFYAFPNRGCLKRSEIVLNLVVALPSASTGGVPGNCLGPRSLGPFPLWRRFSAQGNQLLTMTVDYGVRYCVAALAGSLYGPGPPELGRLF